MSTITPAATFPVAAPFNTSPAYSGTFIPAIWSAKLNAKFYAASVFGDISNTNWEGDIQNVGDKVIINTAPTITVSNYVVGAGLTYQVPVPSTQELLIDKGKYFAFQINDVLEYQSKPNLLDMFSEDAAQQMRIAIDSTVLYNTFNKADAANMGATAGVKSLSYNMGTDAVPVVLTSANVLQKVLEMASVLDEQNVPDSGRWILIDPMTRTLLMQSNIAQAYFTGDATSPVRNGLIGMIDRFKVYVTNQLPKGAAAAGPWVSGDGSENTIAAPGGVKRRAIMAGHMSAITFASQITKMETVRNPNDFGDYIRSLKVYGYKVVAGQGLVLLVAA
jgi:hypothetical protein